MSDVKWFCYECIKDTMIIFKVNKAMLLVFKKKNRMILMKRRMFILYNINRITI